MTSSVDDCRSNCSAMTSSALTTSGWTNGGTEQQGTSGGGGSSGLSKWQIGLTSTACAVIIVGTIVGNILVCTAVAIVRRLRTPSNLLIVSLAVSDLLVAILVMPFATMYEVTGRWDLGPDVCDTWTSLDVFLCTASILNLSAISVDRYFVITRPFQYAMKRTPIRMAMMIVFVWILSALISIPPLVVGKQGSQMGHCQISQAIWYQFYATIGAFYLPLVVMIVIYTRIYLVSSRIASAEARAKPIIAGHQLGQNMHQQHVMMANSGSTTPLRRDSVTIGGANTTSFDRASVPTINSVTMSGAGRNGHSLGSGSSSAAANPDLLAAADHATVNRRRFRLFGKSRLNRISASNERKATKTLGVIMGAFTACWLPFFILALIKPFCRESDPCIPHWLNGIFLWLGYANSFLNPIIYARFNRDFRTPFKHILQCHVRDINVRLRSENYAEQFGRSGVATGCGQFQQQAAASSHHPHHITSSVGPVPPLSTASSGRRDLTVSAVGAGKNGLQDGVGAASAAGDDDERTTLCQHHCANDGHVNHDDNSD